MSLHWRQWQAIGAEQWVVSVLREGYRIPFQHRLPPPSQLPGIVSNIPLRLSKSSRPATRGRDHDFEGGLGESPRSGSRLLQPPLHGGKDVRRLETRDRPLPFQRVRTTNSFQDGNCLLSPRLSEEGRLPGLYRPERRLLPDTCPHLLQEMAPFRFRLNGPPVQSPLLRVVNCPAGLHQSLRDSVGLGPSSSPVSGRLAGTSLYRGQSQAAHLRPSIPVQLPRGNTQQREVRPQSVTVGGVSRHDHRHSGCPSLPYSTSHRQIPHHGEQIPIASGIPAQLWQVLLGHMSSLEKLVPTGRPRMRSLQWHLKSHWSPERDPPILPVPWSRQVEEDLSWWMVRDHLLEGTPFGTPIPDLRLYSDASRAGWGAHLLDQSVLGVWSHQESSLHINLLEMKALFLALRSFKDLVTDHRVTVMCDNSTVVGYVNKQGGTVSDSLCLLTEQLLRWTESNRVQLEARYLPGQSNILADLLSRHNQVLGADWSLHPQVARDLLRMWGSSTLDLFSTHLSAKLPLYCSLIPRPSSRMLSVTPGTISTRTRSLPSIWSRE